MWGDQNAGWEGGGGGQLPAWGGVPFVAQEHVVEIVVDDEQLLGQLLVGDPGDELQDPLLHGPARPVELLSHKQVGQAWAPDRSGATSPARALVTLVTLESRVDSTLDWSSTQQLQGLHR